MMYLEMEEQRRKIKTLRDDAKNTAENNVSLLNSLAHVARVKDKEKNLHTKLKAKKELHFNEK
jgi:ABC-type phosphate transport system auxiliary subunit